MTVEKDNAAQAQHYHDIANLAEPGRRNNPCNAGTRDTWTRAVRMNKPIRATNLTSFSTSAIDAGDACDHDDEQNTLSFHTCCWSRTCLRETVKEVGLH
jgi:hypothetical protein